MSIKEDDLVRFSRKCDNILHLPVVLDHHLTLSRLGGDWECEKGKSDQEHLDEDDAAPELPIVENGQPGELVEADKLLASTSIPHLGANISLHDQMLGSCIYQQDIRL